MSGLCHFAALAPISEALRVLAVGRVAPAVLLHGLLDAFGYVPLTPETGNPLVALGEIKAKRGRQSIGSKVEKGFSILRVRIPSTSQPEIEKRPDFLLYRNYVFVAPLVRPQKCFPQKRKENVFNLGPTDAIITKGPCKIY